MIDATITELAVLVGVKAACAAAGRPGATGGQRSPRVSFRVD